MMATPSHPRALRFRARPGTFLYDCHSRRFAPLDQGRSIVHSFVPLYLSRMFGMSVQDWHGFLRRSIDTLDSLRPELRDGWIAAHAPVHDATQAVDLALLVNPSAERFIHRGAGYPSPFALREEYLFQPNVPLGSLEIRQEDGSWLEILAIPEGAGEEWYRAIRRVLLDSASGSDAGSREAGSPEHRQILGSLRATRALDTEEARFEEVPEPGFYLLGHSSLLIRGRRTGLIIDPVFASALGAHADALRPSALRRASSVVALTHGHFDHYHLPTLLKLSDRPMIVPRVARPSIVCEDLEARLALFGVPELSSPGWDATVDLEEMRLHVLPFVGEQFLTSELYPDARNWGNAYIVECEGLRILVAVDSGFEPGRSVIDLVAEWVSKHGTIDIVAAQAIGLRTAFGGGDPDLQITALACASRSHETVELLRPERRVTLMPEDIPDLCLAAGARWFVPYGQFVVGRGRPGVDSGAAEGLRSLLARLAPGVRMCWLGIGEGFSFAVDGSTVTFPP